ncbi:helix-turn-helix transcriptional regulator [Inquilinus limosus]|uniref:helix-turn-helix transcriptional regulator n=1 Tax=Inquilinus limosus TaxID=171674 RepID=UPI0012DC3A55|nr:LuxR family transcriptional regulator [Inquilinus limosus]
MAEPMRPPSQDALSAVIAQAYDAALGRESWPDLLSRLADLLGSDSSVVLHPTGTPLPRDQAVRLRVDPGFVPLYNAHYHATWPVLPMLPRLPAGTVFVDRMLVPDSAFLRSEFYNDYARPQGRHSGLHWVDVGGDGLGAHLSVWRTRRRPGWGEAEARLLRHIGPHLGRALAVARRLAGPAQPRPPAAIDPDLVAPRELDCLAWVARGASSKQIARQLGLSMHTVNAYLASARRKLKATSRSEAVAMALQLGLIGA